MKFWVKITVFVLFFLIILLSVNEYLLIKAGHLKTMVSDEDLWSIEREKIKELGRNDIVLLGASRMQVNIDLAELKKRFPNSKILQLSLSGRGNSFPVFLDIVENTDFKGIILISENQNSISKSSSQQQRVVKYFHSTFSFDKKINKHIEMWCQSHFLFLNPNSNSERLWGNLIEKQQLPPPMITMTYPSREQTSYFSIGNVTQLYKKRINGIKKTVKTEPPKPEKWLENALHWQPQIHKFKEKGGQLIFIHMPFSDERWQLQNQWMPKEIYWDNLINTFNVKSIHFADHQNLQGFRLPDTSHLDAESKSPFTSELSIILYQIISRYGDE